jgi:hypothetical protein
METHNSQLHLQQVYYIQMETHNSQLHLQQVYYIQWQNEVEQQFSGMRHDIVILRNRRNL